MKQCIKVIKIQVLESDRCGFYLWLCHSRMVGFWPHALVDSFIIGPIIPTVPITRVKRGHR